MASTTTTSHEAAATVPIMDCYDADNHLREPIDAYPRYLDPAFRDRGWRIGPDADGTESLLVSRYAVPRSRFDREARAGSFHEAILRMRAGEDIDPFNGETEPVRPEHQDRDKRLALMDRQGLEATLIYPSIAVSYDWMLDDSDVPLTYANLRAVNRYLAEEWGWAYRSRIHAVAMLSLLDLDLALAELERLLTEGVKVVNLVPGPVGTRSPADPYFDPFWARVNEAGVLVTFHTSQASHKAYRQMLDGFWEPQHQARRKIASDTTSAFMSFQMFNERPIMDTVAALILHNLFGRFQNVKVMSVENGTFWVPFTIKLLNKHFAINQSSFWLGGKPERPSHVFRRHVFVTPFHEENVQSIVDVVGPDCVLFGSDYPHGEGLANPVADYLGDLEVTDPDVVRKIMRDNLKGLLASA